MSRSFPARQDGKVFQAVRRTWAKGEGHKSMVPLEDGKNLGQSKGEGQGERWERQPRTRGAALVLVGALQGV